MHGAAEGDLCVGVSSNVGLLLLCNAIAVTAPFLGVCEAS